MRTLHVPALLVALFGLAGVTALNGQPTINAGDYQTATVATYFSQQLQVRMIGACIDSPCAQYNVTFSVPSTQNASFCTPFCGSGTSVTVQNPTNSEIASVTLLAGTVAGLYLVTATVGSTTLYFHETNISGPAQTITATGGTPQSALMGADYSPLQATVSDAYGNPKSDLVVTFSAPIWVNIPSATFPGSQYSATAVTNSAGVATSPAPTANQVGGAFTISASVAGVSTNASFALNNLVPVRINTSPAGLSFLFGARTFTGPHVFSCQRGTAYQFAAVTPQSAGTGARYVFHNWSDGGAATHSITPGAGAETYTVSYDLQYLLTMSAGTGGTASPPSGYYGAGVVVAIAATPGSGYSFGSWAGSGSGSYSGVASSASVTMNGPIQESASFVPIGTITVDSAPTGLAIAIDGVNYTAPATFTWTAGSTHTISTSSPQTGASGTRYVFANWTDSGAQTHTVTASAAGGSYVANFTVQYLLTMNAGTGGTVSPPTGYYSAGSTVSIAATGSSGYAFQGWTGTGNGSCTGNYSPATVTMNGPIVETAAFGGTAKLDISVSGFWTQSLSGQFIYSARVLITNSTGTTLALNPAVQVGYSAAPSGTVLTCTGCNSGYYLTQSTFPPGSTTRVQFSLTYTTALSQPASSSRGRTRAASLPPGQPPQNPSVTPSEVFSSLPPVLGSSAPVTCRAFTPGRVDFAGTGQELDVNINTSASACGWYIRQITGGFVQASPSDEAQPPSQLLHISAPANPTLFQRHAAIELGSYDDPAALDVYQDAGPGNVNSGLRFVPVPPCRVLETRPAYAGNSWTAGFGPPMLSAGATRTISVSASPNCPGIPGSAKAYVFNVTLDTLESQTGAVDYVTIWPAGETRPNFWTARTSTGGYIANGAIVKAGAGGAIQVYSTNNTHLLLDINGYFTDSTTAKGLLYYPIGPCRAVDTRGPIYSSLPPPYGNQKMVKGETRTLPIPSSPIATSNCLIPAAAAYSLQMTLAPGDLTNGAPVAFVTAWPSGQTQPTISNMNSIFGYALANSGIVPARSSDGSINVYAFDPTNLILDVNGYFAPDDGTGRGLYHYPVTQCRFLNTQDSSYSGMFGGPQMTPAADRTVTIPMSSQCPGLPSTAKAWALNATVMPNGAPMPFLSMWPAGTPWPIVSQLNAFQGQTVSNSAIVPGSSNGSILVKVNATTHVAIEVSGYFAR